jgi:hypothetical protein
LPGTIAPFLTTGICCIELIARIHEYGGLMIEVNSSIQNMHKLEIVKVLPSQSEGCNFLLFAFVAKSFTSTEIWESDLV